MHFDCDTLNFVDDVELGGQYGDRQAEITRLAFEEAVALNRAPAAAEGHEKL